MNPCGLAFESRMYIKYVTHDELDTFITCNIKRYVTYHFRPDLIQYDKLQKSNALYNLNNAFEVAEEKLGLTRLLDPEGQ